MKTKEELLKIYSVYLPYGLEVKLSDEGKYNLDSEYPNEHANKTGVITEFSISNGDFGYGEFKVSEKYYFSINELSEIKPILYSMEMLTQEIERNGERFVPIDKFEIGDDSDSYPIEYDHGNIKLIKELESIAKHNSYHDVQFLPFEVVQRLISWHFNVFGLSESQYIKKETLNRSENPNS